MNNKIPSNMSDKEIYAGINRGDFVTDLSEEILKVVNKHKKAYGNDPNIPGMILTAFEMSLTSLQHTQYPQLLRALALSIIQKL